MASCEKCWRDAHGDPREYAILVEERNRPGRQCTPEQQAGPDATECRGCGRMTVHQHCGVCMVPVCETVGHTVEVPCEQDTTADLQSCGENSHVAATPITRAGHGPIVGWLVYAPIEHDREHYLFDDREEAYAKHREFDAMYPDREHAVEALICHPSFDYRINGQPEA